MSRLREVKIPEDLQVGSIHKSNGDGKFKIVSYKNSSDVIVKFLKTGFITSVAARNLRVGSIRDKLSPDLHGVAFMGKGEHLSRSLGKANKSYITWVNMLNRAYSKSYHLKSPTYKNCTVAKEWHNYQNFASWYEEHYKEGLALDKDVLQRGVANKIYSPETCIFITLVENTLESACKEYKFRSPKGELTVIRNMAQFCKDNPKLLKSGMSQVATGIYKQHHGWTLWVEPTTTV